MRILTVCLNPTFQITMVHPSLTLGEVNRAREHYEDISGKGMNSARVLGQLGHHSVLLTHLGGIRRDEHLALAQEEHVHLLWADSKSEIRTCITILGDGVTTELVQEPFAVDPSTEGPIRELFTTALADVDAVIITGTRAGGYSADLYPSFVKEAKERGLFVLLDLKGDDLKNSLLYRPDIIKPNLSEFVDTFFGLSIGEHEMNSELEERIKVQLKHIYTEYGTTTFLSRGKEASWIQSEKFFSLPSEPVKVVNTIGCGDTLSAVLTAQLASGSTLEEAAKEAIYWAGVNAQQIRPGTIK